MSEDECFGCGLHTQGAEDYCFIRAKDSIDVCPCKICLVKMNCWQICDEWNKAEDYINIRGRILVSTWMKRFKMRFVESCYTLNRGT